MNREIKFRGFSEELKKWIFGGISIFENEAIIFDADDMTNSAWEVETESVGQFTGFKSVKGKQNLVNKDIYEGDIFRQEKNNEQGEPYFNYLVVMWIRQRGAFYLIPVEHYHILIDNDCENEPEFNWLFEDACLYDFAGDVCLPIIGNVYQNQELLK